MDLRQPTLSDVLAARKHVYRHLKPTPLHAYAALSELIGADVYVKHENHHAVGSFKVRGGVNLAAHLSESERQAGLYTASTGNHGQSIAFAGMVSGTPVRVSLPEGANPDKMASIKRLGAEVIVHGRDFDEAREWSSQEAEAAGARFIGPTEPELIAGVGTYSLEILEELPNVDVIIVPVGAGSGASATCIVAKTINQHIQVIGVQSKQAPAVQNSWKAGQLVGAAMNSRSEGVATRIAHENTLRIMHDTTSGLDDFVLVSDDAQDNAVRLLLEHTHNAAETAGAASLAAALELKQQLAGKKIVLILSGGNITASQLKTILTAQGC